MRDEPLETAATVMSRRVGLRLDPSLRGRLGHSLNAAAAAARMPLDAYAALLETDERAFQDLLDRITVQETSFFRDPAQFQALADHLLPGARVPVTIWSAGCANGQEAYSLAIVLTEAGHTTGRVLATDISNRALARARAGIYDDREMKGLSAERRARFFTREPAGWRVSADLQAMVTFRYQNLVAAGPPFAPGECLAILCRNVLIYFRGEEIAAAVGRFHDWLPDGGHLFLGHSESLWQVTDRFRLVRLGDAFVYRRGGIEHASPIAPEPATRKGRSGAAARVPVGVRPAPAGPAPSSPRVPAGPPSPATREVAAEMSDALAAGEAASAAGDHAAAVTAFRRATYLLPEDPVGHFHLGLSCEAAGDRVAALRAFRAARTALQSGNLARIEAALEGFDLAQFRRVLDARLGDAG